VGGLLATASPSSTRDGVDTIGKFNKSLRGSYRKRNLIVMDPLSIISAVVTGDKTIYAVTESVLTFVNEVRTVNQLIQGIYDEVNSLCRTFDSINCSLESPPLASAIAGNEETNGLWPPVLKSLQDCELTIHQLYNSLKGFKTEKTGVAARTMMAIKFNRSERDIQVLKSRV
jgi:hypothetical protein